MTFYASFQVPEARILKYTESNLEKLRALKREHEVNARATKAAAAKRKQEQLERPLGIKNKVMHGWSQFYQSCTKTYTDDARARPSLFLSTILNTCGVISCSLGKPQQFRRAKIYAVYNSNPKILILIKFAQ